MKLIAFDGDHTLWTPLDGVNLSDRTPTDDAGNEHFEYKLLEGDVLMAVRDDGARFRLRREVAGVLADLKKRGVLRGVISYNHEGNVRRILDAFGLLVYIDYIVAEWHSQKDKMLGKMLAQAREEGYNVAPGEMLLVDDDPAGIYRGQCQRLGVGFACFGADIKDLRDVLSLLEGSLVQS